MSDINITIDEPAAITVEVELAPVGPQGPIGPQGIQGPQGDPGGALPTGVDKTIQFNDGGVMGGNTFFRFDKNNNTVVLGLPDALPTNPLNIGGAVDSYLQVNIHNTTEGASASADYVCTADDGTDAMGYIDLGISSSVYDDDEFQCTKAHDGYILNVTETDFVIASAGAATSKTRFYSGGLMDTDHILDIDPSGITLVAGKTITDRPPIFYGTGSPPSATGLPNGALFFKYTP
jgi:hypothetical protein